MKKTPLDRRTVLFVVLVFILGGILGIAGYRSFLCCSLKEREALSRRAYHPYTNPALDYEALNKPDKDLVLVKYKIQGYIKEKIVSGAAAGVSVYIRDLSNGPWVGIDEDADFSPASLLKLPIMMAYFKLAEEDPSVLKRVLRCDDMRASGLPQEIVPLEHVKFGEAYTVEELIRRMIVFSDNTAKNMLMLNIPPEHLRTTFSNMHLFIANVRAQDDYLSVVDYASLFRVLYNAGYLGREMSGKALDLLTQSQFRGGLVAGVPAGIKTAHKFGEREIDAGHKQLHDCGIVYYPGSPYIICVMTRGRDIDALAGIIRDISRIVYEDKIRRGVGGR